METEMSGQSQIRSTETNGMESRPVLVPAGNKVQPKLVPKPIKKSEKVATQVPELKDNNSNTTTKKLAKLHSPVLSPARKLQLPHSLPQRSPLSSSILRRNVSLSSSCSSDASSSDASSLSRVSSSSGRKGASVVRRNVNVAVRRKQCEESSEKERAVSGDSVLVGKKRCAWVSPNTDPCYAAFHDEEWGVPVHEDKKLFELLTLSGALAELAWPAILVKRHIFREVFLDFDPVAVSKLSEKKILMPGSPAHSLVSELKLRSIIENGRQICKVINEFGSFDKYIWNYVNNKPIVNQFRYPRQVPVKSSKADLISKDLVRRGFRSVGPTVIYTFMQVAGLTNDHLVSCFRFQECVTGLESESGEPNTKPGN